MSLAMTPGHLAKDGCQPGAGGECFGFEARTSFEEGLRRTIDWYLTVGSINDYLSSVGRHDFPLPVC